MKLSKLFAAILLAATSAGCALGESTGEAPDRPTVLGLTRTSVSVGQSMEIVGGNFLNGGQGHTEVRLIGTFTTKSGNTHDVDMRFQPHWEDGNRLMWANFGPFSVPFGTGDELGVFDGKLYAINVSPDGVESASDPQSISLEVEPSIIIRDFQPLTAECIQPSKIILGGYPYRVKAEAVGFTPENFSYVIAGEPSADAPRIMRHLAKGNTDEFGLDAELVFEPVPADAPFYVVTLAVTALGTDGYQYASSLSFGVHRPIEYINANTVKVAEVELARPVSNCIPGGDTVGRTVTYSEQETDTRSRTVGVTWDETWLESHTGEVGGSSSTTNSTSVSVNQSSTQGWEMNWNDSFGTKFEANGGGSLFGVVEVGVSGGISTEHSEGGRVYGSNTQGYTVGRDYSQTDTESWAFSSTQGHNVSKGGSDFWTVSSSSSTITTFQGQVLPGTFGVFYRQTTRLALPGAIVHYNMCGIPTVVAQTNFYDYVWSVDLATDQACPPFPESNLPEPQCYIAPCKTPQ